MRSNQRRLASEHFQQYWSDGCELALWLISLGRRPTDSRIVGIAAWSRRVDGFPVDFGKRSAGREPLDEVGIGDVGSSERDQVREPLGDQAIASFGGRSEVGDQLAAKDGA